MPRLNLTLAEFFQLIVQEARKYGIESLHAHWRPIHLICFPCKVHYQFYGDALNIKQELPTIVANLTGTPSSSINMRKQWDQYGTHTRTSQMLASIDKTLLKQVSELYKIDYQMFGFQYPDPRTLQ